MFNKRWNKAVLSTQFIRVIMIKYVVQINLFNFVLYLTVQRLLYQGRVSQSKYIDLVSRGGHLLGYGKDCVWCSQCGKVLLPQAILEAVLQNLFYGAASYLFLPDPLGWSARAQTLVLLGLSPHYCLYFSWRFIFDLLWLLTTVQDENKGGSQVVMNLYEERGEGGSQANDSEVSWKM